MMKLPERSEGNFFMFLKTNEGYLSQIVLKNMQFLVNYTFHEPTFIVSYLYGFRPFDQLSKARPSDP